ncbi:MAG: discoidin domain-containing protein [Ilumatobacteraceae bacterium]
MTHHRTTRAFAGLVVAATLIAACGGGGDEEQVRPFAEVQADEFVFENDPTSNERGIFRVTTTEPMICAIVWGETEDLGNFNNSLAMNGTGIVDHDVFLPGAEPGATYFFRVQGSTADGTLYQSELATFTLPERDDAPSTASPEHGPNLALDGTVADVSSEFNDSFAAANAIDDVGTTEWSSRGDGDDAFITIDLGAVEQIAGVEYITRSMLDGTAIAETFTVTIDDGEPLGPFPAGTPIEPNFAAIDAEGRTVRFDVESSTGGNVGAVEVRVLAP